jgi:hypothetical protein
MAKPTGDTVYPVEGTFLNGVPAAALHVSSKALAGRLVDTGAFTTTPTPLDEVDGVKVEREVIDISDESTITTDAVNAALDFYDPPKGEPAQDHPAQPDTDTEEA